MPTRRLLSQRASRSTTSAIRDLLEHAQRPGMISLAGGLPDPDLFPAEALAVIADAAVRTGGGRHLQYGLTAGEQELRDHIVATTAAASTAEEILVTTGSQQGLDLLADVLIDPGDTVIVADPEYLGATQAFRRAGAELVPVPVDGAGLDTDALESLLGAGVRPKFTYVVPHFHNPSGATLSEERRTHLLDLAARFGFLAVFDDPYRDLYLDGLSPDDPGPHPAAAHLRSTSKILSPGLRVGWTIGPSWLVGAMEQAKQSADLHTSTIGQAIVLAALESSWFSAHLDRIRSAALIKRDALCEALDLHLGDRIDYSRPGGGMFVWASFTDGTTTEALLNSALEQGVAFVPGAAFSVARNFSAHLRLSWATASPDELEEGVVRLAAARPARAP